MVDIQGLITKEKRLDRGHVEGSPSSLDDWIDWMLLRLAMIEEHKDSLTGEAQVKQV
jgi:hypothetical protein